MSIAARGEVHDQTYYYPLRVYYEDTDAGGIVYHANYLRFAERARTELLRFMGFNQIELRETDDILFVVKTINVDYMKPTRLDDSLVVRVEILRFGRSSFTLRQTICFDSDTRRAQHTLDIAAQMDVTLVCINSKAKPVRISEKIRSAFESHLKVLDAA